MSICARVLVAALMAGAIAAVVAFPARFGPGGEPGRVIVAPPSSQQRAVHLPALPATRRHAALVVVHVTNRTIAPARTSERPIVATPSRPQPTRPAGKATPTEPTRTLAAATPAQAPPAPPIPAAPKQHGHGHAYGHEKPHGKPQAPSEPTPPATTPPPADGSAQPTTDEDASAQGHGQGHAYGHDK